MSLENKFKICIECQTGKLHRSEAFKNTKGQLIEVYVCINCYATCSSIDGFPVS